LSNGILSAARVSAGESPLLGDVSISQRILQKYAELSFAD
jgi:hypothetical protein